MWHRFINCSFEIKFIKYNDSTQNKRNHIPFWLFPRWLGGRCVIHRADIWNSYCSECCSTPASSCSLSADFHKVSKFWGYSCILLQIPEYSSSIVNTIEVICSTMCWTASTVSSPVWLQWYNVVKFAEFNRVILENMAANSMMDS